MADTKNVSLVEEKKRELPDHNPSRKEQEVVEATWKKFRNSFDERNQNLEYLDGLNLIDYIDDSVRRFATNIDERDNIEDWQARVHDPFTRNKVIAVLGKVAQVLPIAEVVGRGDEDIRRSQILTNLYEYSEEVDDYEQFAVDFLLEAIVKGTAIGYEGYLEKTQDIRDVVKGHQDEIKIKKGQKVTRRLFADIVRVEDFYPSSLGIKNIKNMPYCFWRTVVPYQQFLQDFAMYDKADKVSPFHNFGDDEDRPYYLDFVTSTVGEGNVEIIRYYNQDTDEYIILANGVWLNPVKISNENEGSEEVSPLPFKHKTLPFFSTVFERFGSDFFYGKSLPDKLKSLQDVLNVLTNMLLDQSFMTIFPPMLTSGFDSIEDDYLRPGRRTPVDTQGLSLNDQFSTIDMGTPQGWHQFIIEYTRGVMEEASVDQVSQGVAGVGERTTAQEIRVAAEGVAAMLGLFGRFVKGAIQRKATLRVQNIMEFWTKPESPVIEGVLGGDGAKNFNKAFNTFKIENAVLTTGKRGSKVIEMFSKRNQMPSRRQVKARADAFEVQTGQKIEIVAIEARYIRNIDFDIKLVPNPKTEQTKEAEKALALEKTRVYMTFFPDLVDRSELAANLAESMGDDPTKIIKEQVFQQALPQDQTGETNQTVNRNPEGNFANNLTRGLRSGEQGQNVLNQIAGNITG